MTDLISQILQKVAERGRRLDPPLNKRELASFENQHRIELPQEYRRFLTEVGNGGPGPPAYGLVPLGHGPQDHNRQVTEYWERLPDVTRPFPFTSPWVWEAGDKSEEGCQDQIRHGSIFLGTDGCGMDWHLIVTGPERGNIWLISGEGITPTHPKRGFLRWYSDWLEGVEDWWV